MLKKQQQVHISKNQVNQKFKMFPQAAVAATVKLPGLTVEVSNKKHN